MVMGSVHVRSSDEKSPEEGDFFIFTKCIHFMLKCQVSKCMMKNGAAGTENSLKSQELIIFLSDIRI